MGATERSAMTYKKATAALDEAARARLRGPFATGVVAVDDDDRLVDLVHEFYDDDVCPPDATARHGDVSPPGGSTDQWKDALREALAGATSDATSRIRVEAERAVRDASAAGVCGEAIRRRVVERLRARGLEAGVCRSSWERNGSAPAGSHEYVDVTTAAGQRYVVEVNVAAEFEIARPSAEYRGLLDSLPHVLVARPEAFREVAAAMCAAAAESIRGAGMHLPPWRKARYVQAKWSAPYKRVLSPAAAMAPEGGRTVVAGGRKRCGMEIGRGEMGIGREALVKCQTSLAPHQNETRKVASRRVASKGARVVNAFVSVAETTLLPTRAPRTNQRRIPKFPFSNPTNASCVGLAPHHHRRRSRRRADWSALFSHRSLAPLPPHRARAAKKHGPRHPLVAATLLRPRILSLPFRGRRRCGEGIRHRLHLQLRGELHLHRRFRFPWTSCAAAAERHVGGGAAADTPARSVRAGGEGVGAGDDAAVAPRHAARGPAASGVRAPEGVGGGGGAGDCGIEVGDGAGEPGILDRDAAVRCYGEPGHAGSGADGGGGHRQRRVVGAVQAVPLAAVLQPKGPPLRPDTFVLLLRRAVRLAGVLEPKALRQRLLLRWAVRLRRQLRRRVNDHRCVQLRRADSDRVGFSQGVPLRLWPLAAGSLRRHRWPPRPRPAISVARVTGVEHIRRRLLVLPTTDAEFRRVSHAGRVGHHHRILHDAAADGVERSDILHGDARGDQRRGAAAGNRRVGVRVGRGGGHGHGGHAATPDGVRRAPVGVPRRHGAVRIPDGAGHGDPRHLLRLQPVRQRDAADDLDLVRRRRGHGPWPDGYPHRRVPRVRAHRRRHTGVHPRERAAAVVRGAIRRQHRRLHAWLLLIDRF